MPGIIDLLKFKCGDFEWLQVDRIHLEFTGNASRYIHSVTTPTPLLLLFIPYKFSVGMTIKFGITKEKGEKGAHYKTVATKRSYSFNESLCEKI